MPSDASTVRRSRWPRHPLSRSRAARGGDRSTEDDGRIDVVASTNVYGQIAEEIGGDLVDVTSIVVVDRAGPALVRAERPGPARGRGRRPLIENGGGYDAFIDALIEASGSSAAHAVSSRRPVEFSAGVDRRRAPDDDSERSDEGDDDHDHEHVEGFNEHVWYDPQAMSDLAEAIAARARAP